VVPKRKRGGKKIKLHTGGTQTESSSKRSGWKKGEGKRDMRQKVHGTVGKGLEDTETENSVPNMRGKGRARKGANRKK